MDRALSTSGGGQKGATFGGYLKYIVDNNVYTEYFNLLSGVSVGALTIVGLAQYRPEEFPEGVDFLLNMWRKIKSNKDVWKFYFPKYVAGLFRNSFGNNEALKDFLNENIDFNKIKKSKIKLILPAVNLNSGKIKYFTEQDDVFKAAIASSSFPIFFPPENISGELFSDGGLADIIAVKPILKMGYKDILMLLLHNPENMAYKTNSQLNTVPKVALRMIDIMSTETYLDDIDRALFINQLIQDCEDQGIPLPKSISDKIKINIDIIRPIEPLGSDSLEFDPEMIEKEIQIGYKSAKNYFENRNKSRLIDKKGF